MDDTTTTSKKILQLSAAALCLCVSALAVVTLFEVRRVSAMTIDYISDARQMQKDVEAQAKDATEIASEAFLYGAATLLEQNRALPRTDAEKIKSESIDNIAKRSERWGKIIKAVNDTTTRPPQR